MGGKLDNMSLAFRVLTQSSVPAAGIIRDRPFLEHTEQDFRASIDVNVSI
jgi:hypothetical protein